MKYSSSLKKILFLIVIISGILLLVVIVSFFMAQRGRSYPGGVSIGERSYTLEYALTKEEQALGLGGRDMLCGTCAMAFPFALPERQAFWMKDMRFPLDIIWLSQDGTVVHIEHRVSQESQEIYQPEERASQVLEFNAGALDTVRAGDTLHFFSSRSSFPLSQE